MAVPKRKTSTSKRNSRRANWKVAVPSVVNCSHCQQPKQPHRVCPSCGHYDGRQITETE